MPATALVGELFMKTAQIKEALDRSRSEYLQSLSEKARGAREGSERLGNGDSRAAHSRENLAM